MGGDRAPDERPYGVQIARATKTGGESMALCSELQNFIDDLDNTISDVMQTDVAEIIKAEISESAKENVYAHEPKFYSRRMGDGGVMDPRTMEQAYDGNQPDVKTLEVYSTAPWQHLWGGFYPKDDLSDAIEAGTEKYHMAKAGPRPFYGPAEQHLMKTGLIDAVLENGVKREMDGKSY